MNEELMNTVTETAENAVSDVDTTELADSCNPIVSAALALLVLVGVPFTVSLAAASGAKLGVDTDWQEVRAARDKKKAERKIKREERKAAKEAKKAKKNQVMDDEVEMEVNVEVE